MKTFQIEIVQVVTVKLDETKFDETFMSEFRDSFFQFDSIEEHAEHIAQLEARGLIADYKPFIEGYGPAEDMGITTKVETVDTDIIRGGGA
ncbi:hypothetical protein [Novosphingobium sp. KN65.2]|uniref:hypothetical protein n=1 Tax=Novosphingobium sp. KN65.2 TaxID=1478134 RepID=UPI0005DB57A0|nr:hypothetical protein [Novosphingobium sp. KN65.2]CDO35794.1 conserved hypothetical protein [Novosphingobium sp. KN65.2]